MHDEDFIRRSRDTLRASEDELDEATVRRLREIRHTAVEAARDESRPKRLLAGRNLRGGWLPVAVSCAVVAAAAVLVLTEMLALAPEKPAPGLVQAPRATEPQAPQTPPVPPELEPPASEIEVLLSAADPEIAPLIETDELDLYEDLEFYEWLAEIPM
jgi:hypothetical protein